MKVSRIGIDLGSVNSLVGYTSEDGTRKLIPNANGSVTHASYIAWTEEGALLVGNEAKEKGLPGRVIYGSKALMGLMFKDVAMAGWTGPPISSDKQQRPVFTIDAVEYLAVEVAALILGYLRNLAEENLGYAITGAVISVPAYFDMAQLQATKDAALIAGFKLTEIRVVAEPTAALVEHTLATKCFKNFEVHRVIVFDCGGQTFDSSAVEASLYGWEVKGTDGNLNLGGQHFSKAVAADFYRQLEEHGHAKGLMDAADHQAITQAAEEVKCALAEKEIVENKQITLSSGQATVRLSRKSFERMMEQPVAQCINHMEEAMKVAGWQSSDIDEIVLAGGSSRMACIPSKLKRRFRKMPVMVVNPEEVVARGAIAVAAMADNILSALTLTDVVPIGLGIMLAKTNRRGQKERFNHILVPKGTPYPIETEYTCPTGVNFQRTADVYILQGDSEDIEKCSIVAHIARAIKNPERYRAREVTVEFKMFVGIDGTLTVRTLLSTETEWQTDVVNIADSVLKPAEREQLIQKYQSRVSYPVRPSSQDLEANMDAPMEDDEFQAMYANLFADVATADEVVGARAAERDEANTPGASSRMVGRRMAAEPLPRRRLNVIGPAPPKRRKEESSSSSESETEINVGTDSSGEIIVGERPDRMLSPTDRARNRRRSIRGMACKSVTGRRGPHNAAALNVAPAELLGAVNPSGGGRDGAEESAAVKEENEDAVLQEGEGDEGSGNPLRRTWDSAE